jgi:hypothetical protein
VKLGTALHRDVDVEALGNSTVLKKLLWHRVCGLWIDFRKLRLCGFYDLGAHGRLIHQHHAPTARPRKRRH